MSLTHRSTALSKGKKSLLYDSAIVLAGHEGAVYTAKFCPNGQSIASGGHDKSILLWHLPTSAEESTPNYGVLQGHKNAVTSLSWVLDASLFAVSADNTVSFWDAETGLRTRKGVGHELVVNDCSTTVGGSCFSVGDDGYIRVWDEREKNLVVAIKTPYPLLCCASSKDGSTVFVSGVDPAIRAFDIRKQEQIWKCDGILDSVTSLNLNSDDSMLVAKAMDGTIRTLSAKSTVPPGIPRMSDGSYPGASENTDQLLTRAAFTHDDVYIGLGASDAALIIWGTASRRMVHKFPGHSGTVIDVDFHPREKIGLSTSSDGTIIVRDY